MLDNGGIRGILLVVLALASIAAGQQGTNWNGWGDTARINSFAADSLKYSKTFNLSSFENCVFTAYARDTGTAGFGSDSVNFAWGIQWGHPSWVSTSAKSPTMEWGPRLIIDTLNMLTAGNFVVAPLSLAADYTFVSQKLTIDSSTVSGWAFQRRAVSPEWDVNFRFWCKGITGNKIAQNISLVFQVARRINVQAR